MTVRLLDYLLVGALIILATFCFVSEEWVVGLLAVVWIVIWSLFIWLESKYG